MSKFALTGVLLCILVGFFHYNPQPTNSANDSSNKEKESLIFPLSEQIKLARMEKHITQKELADRVGLSDSNLEKIEKGQVVPTHDILLKLERQLNKTFTMDNY